MQHLETFSSFTQQAPAFVRPELYYNERLKCLRINDHYLFLEENKVLHRSDKALHEFLGFDLSSMLPQTTSDWIHLGVDLTAAGAGAVFAPLGIGIDVLHGISYFIEARYKPQEADKLYLSGIITLVIGAIPGAGAALAGILKGLMKAAGKVVGWFFKALFKMATFGRFTGKAVGFLMRMSAVRAFIGKGVQKLTEGKLGQMISKLPIVKTVLNFIKKDLDTALEKVGTHLTRDLFAYSKSVVAAMRPEMKAMYKVLDKKAQQSISEKEFMEISEAMLHKKMTGVGSVQEAEKLTGNSLIQAKDAMRNFFAGGGSGRETAKKFLTSNTAALNASLEKIAIENDAFVTKAMGASGAKRLLLSREFNRLVNIEVTKQLRNGVALNAIKVERAAIMREAMKSVGTSTAKAAGKAVVKRTGLSAAKNVVNHSNGIDTSDLDLNPFDNDTTDAGTDAPGDSGAGSGGDDTTRTIPAPEGTPKTGEEPKGEEPKTGDEPKGEEPKGGEEQPATPKVDKDRFFLKEAEVKSITELGSSELVFHTPKKDDTEGKLVLRDGMYDTVDMTEKIQPYPTGEALLADIKLVKGKDKKERVRDGELKKWERSVELSTPHIADENTHYSFHFMVRDRAAISFAKKSLDEKIDWASVFSKANVEKGFVKLGQSLYVIIKKQDAA